jgi:hypothetical protein
MANSQVLQFRNLNNNCWITTLSDVLIVARRNTVLPSPVHTIYALKHTWQPLFTLIVINLFAYFSLEALRYTRTKDTGDYLGKLHTQSRVVSSLMGTSQKILAHECLMAERSVPRDTHMFDCRSSLLLISLSLSSFAM